MKFEQYMKLIEDTHSSHVKGDLNEMEYINAYNEILGVVIDSDTLNEEEKRQLITIVRTKIGQIPKVEEMRKEIKNQELLAKEEAFLEAKKRFKSLSLFQKVKLNIKGQAPKQLNQDSMDTRNLRGLYRK